MKQQMKMNSVCTSDIALAAAHREQRGQTDLVGTTNIRDEDHGRCVASRVSRFTILHPEGNQGEQTGEPHHRRQEGEDDIGTKDCRPGRQFPSSQTKQSPIRPCRACDVQKCDRGLAVCKCHGLRFVVFIAGTPILSSCSWLSLAVLQCRRTR